MCIRDSLEDRVRHPVPVRSVRGDVLADVAVRDEELSRSVVVEVVGAGAPAAHHDGGEPQAGGVSGGLEVTLRGVAEDGEGLAAERRQEDIGAPVRVESGVAY